MRPPEAPGRGRTPSPHRDLVDATTIEQVQDAVRGRAGRVRALGTRHSFHDLADTDGTLITVTGHRPDAGARRGARARSTVGGGIRYGELALWLEERGLGAAQHGLAAAHLGRRARPRPSTHGSGNALGTLVDRGARARVRRRRRRAAHGRRRRPGLRRSRRAPRRDRHRHPADARDRADLRRAAGRLRRACHGTRCSTTSTASPGRPTASASSRAGRTTAVAVIRKTRLGDGVEPDLPEDWRGRIAARRRR